MKQVNSKNDTPVTQSGMDIIVYVSKAQKGDQQAFSLIYDHFVQQIFKFIRYKVQNRQEAEDLLQDVFVKAYKGLPALPLKDLNFQAWLYRVASNSINDHFRKIYRAPETLELDEKFDLADKTSLEHEMENISDMDTVREAFTKLPLLYKQVLELRFLQEFSVEETAKILKKSNLSVRLLQHRAIKKVKGILL